jgi:predicted CXXCH cytochrome family protein
MGLKCTGCHAAAAASTNPTDDLLPAKQVCRQCHGDTVAPQRPAPLPIPLAHFSHSLHLRMGNVAPFLAKAIDKGNYLQLSADVRPFLNTTNACQACHRGLEQSDRVTAAAMPKMADCLVCHVTVELPWSCEQCHSKQDKLTPASHDVEHFFDLHSRGTLHLDKTTCAVCHGREFTCMGCH